MRGEKLFLASASHRPKLNTRPIPAFFQVVPGRTPYPSDAVAMNTATKEQLTPESNDICTIVVLYDCDATRARALTACDFLVNQFWQDVELEFHWWRTDFLRDETLATVASANAVASDFLIVCLESHREISPALESWFENWVTERHDREGALVDLTSPLGSREKLTLIQTFLKEVSQHGNFDYLTAIPGDGWNAKMDNQPAKEYFQRIDDILSEPRPPSHFGLNE
jgi:hypothetical protein